MVKVGDKASLDGFDGEYTITGVYFDYIGIIDWYSWRCSWSDGSGYNGLTEKQTFHKMFKLRGK